MNFDPASMLQGLSVGIVSGAISARIAIAVLANDIRWIKHELDRAWAVIDKLEKRG